MKIILLSSLAKVFKDTEPNFSEFTVYSILKNEPFSFQAAVLPENKDEETLTLTVTSSLKSEIKLYSVEDIPSGLSGYDDCDSFYYDTSRTEFPDLLRPTDGKLTLKSGEWSSVWIEYTPKKEAVGNKKITLAFDFGKETIEKVFNLKIIDAALPEQELLFTNWFHNDCLCTWYKVKPFSEEYWAIAESFIKNAAEHGMNMILTPIFTPPLDTAVGSERPTVQLVGVKKDGKSYSFDYTNFERYIDICLKNGIKAFEISHLFTQWGAKAAPKIVADVNGQEKKIFGWLTKSTGKTYNDFLKAFADSFIPELIKLGIKDKCWLHVSDEPSKRQINGYKKAADIIHALFPGFHTFDALSDIDYYRKGLIETPVCGEQEADLFKSEVKSFWTYYCCGQTRENLPNRLFAMPSERNRVLGILLYKYDAKGFLQWGHNFWYSQYSVKELDPFKVSDAGGAFPSGDSYVVYPGDDKKPLNSLRHIVFADGLRDMRALTLLESLTSREHVLKLIERNLYTPLTFKNYPHEQDWLLSLRENVNCEIADNI